MPKAFESKAFKASPGSDSLKTTVPQSVATVLGLEPGDSISWEVDVTGRSAMVRKGSGASPSLTKGAAARKRRSPTI